MTFENVMEILVQEKATVGYMGYLNNNHLNVLIPMNMALKERIPNNIIFDVDKKVYMFIDKYLLNNKESLFITAEPKNKAVMKEILDKYHIRVQTDIDILKTMQSDLKKAQKDLFDYVNAVVYFNDYDD